MAISAKWTKWTNLAHDRWTKWTNLQSARRTNSYVSRLNLQNVQNGHRKLLSHKDLQIHVV